MNPDELSEDEKWTRFHAAMAKEEDYIAIEEARRRQREQTRQLINWAAILWLVFAVWGLAWIAWKL